VEVYTQGLMDLGALLCTRSKPQCAICPAHRNCAAHQTGRVAHLPTPHPRKVLPEKHSTFLLLLDGAEILLEKRLGSGIWGGLWCLPQADEVQDIPVYCAQHFGVNTAQVLALPVFIHTFTHFKLHIAPQIVQVVHKPKQMQEPGRMWLDVDDALHAAIPTPVRKVLQELQARRAVA
jgi:A/G-specific adenine glycosylase